MQGTGTDQVELHIYKKFEVLQKLGQGAYGVVWKAIDRKTKQVVALKKVFDAFHNATDAQRTFREVMILQELNGHENIVRLLNVIKAENNKDIYLVFDYMETDLHAVIRANILDDIHKVFITYQILKSLKFLHTGEIIHRDLKPSNVLIDSNCFIKLADFGLARSIASEGEEGDPNMTEYVATRWYRAPEIVLGSNKYSKAVDVWSVGCILGEQIIGKAIFPGKSTIGQIELILDLIGKPKPEDVNSLDSESAWNVLNSQNIKQKYTISQLFKGASKSAIDFLKKTLEFNPKKRISIEEALKHPFVEQFHNPEEEICCDRVIKIPISDHKKLSIKEYQHALYSDIIKKKKEQRRRWQQKYLQQLGISVDEGKTDEDLLKLAQARKKDEDEKKKQYEKKKQAEKQKEMDKRKEYDKQKEYEKYLYQQQLKEQQRKEQDDKQKYQQKQQSKGSNNHETDNHQQENGYLKKSKVNGDAQKQNPKMSSSNQAYEQYQGPNYAQKPTSQQSKEKPYYKNK